jgi:hypothetical protein
LHSPFRTFKVQTDGDLHFTEALPTLNEAKIRVRELGEVWPGEYGIDNESNRSPGIRQHEGQGEELTGALFLSVCSYEQTTLYRIWYKDVLWNPPCGWGGRLLCNKERWEELCELASKEQDPQKLSELIKEINGLLEAKLNRLKANRRTGDE